MAEKSPHLMSGHKEVGLVYGLRRRKTHGQLMRVELGESFDHLKQAAAHAAGGLGESVGPRVAAVRVYVKPANVRQAATHGWESTMAAFGPVAAAARDGAHAAQKAQAKQMKKWKKEQSMSRSKPSRSRWPVLVGLLAAGAAVGAAGAAVMRRRRRMQWDEYDATQALEGMDTAKGPSDRTMEKASTGVGRAMDATARAADKASENVPSAADTATDRMETATETAKRQAERTPDKTDDLISRSGSPSKNSRT